MDLTILTKSFLIKKIKNILIYEDKTFTNRDQVIRGDWDSLLYGKLIKKFPLLFALIKRGRLVMFICTPIMIGVSSIMIFGVAPAVTSEDGYKNLKVLVITLVTCYIFSVITLMVHAFLLKQYKAKAVLDKALAETKQLTKIVPK
ncbi:hypothetical protein IT402_01530 [Candidatus Nomurabacteria bacterium]|nr:hypothetical protein [Candidatus Nomurabacteria bacterium]